MLVIVVSAGLHGVDGHQVQVGVHVGRGLPGFQFVGASDAVCRTNRDRIRAALLTAGFRWPAASVTVDVTPERGRLTSGLDLAVAVGLLAADGQLDPGALAGRGFIGELGLDGSIRPVPGTTSLVDAIEAPEVIVAEASAAEASACAGGRRVLVASHLRDLVAALAGQMPWPTPPVSLAAPADGSDQAENWAELRSSAVLRCAAVVAAAGGHHLFLGGPHAPAVWALARVVASLLPDLSDDHAKEVSRVWSATGRPLPPSGLIRRPPLRHADPTASAVSLVGGGHIEVRPGEISLAHRGVLLLNELAEFAPAVLDHLRAPLESGAVRITTSNLDVVLPARFQLVAAAGYCACRADTLTACRCSEAARQRYASRVSGWLLDRFDLVPDTPLPGVVGDRAAGGSVMAAARRVREARDRARARGVTANVHLDGKQLAEFAPLTKEASHQLEQAVREGRLTGRGHDAVWRVALTVADVLDAEPPIGREHTSVALALHARPTVGWAS
jgi:magnesium chelatase family protein